MHRLKLDILHAWGSNCMQNLTESVSLITFDNENQRILYPCGRYLALKNLNSNETDYIQIPENANQITGIALSPDRSHIALSHISQNDPCPMISIFNIQNAFLNGEKQRNFRYTESQADSITLMTFSHNTRYLVCLTSARQLLFIDLNRMKVVGQSFLQLNVQKIQVNPEETHLISISGNNCFRILRIQEKTVKFMQDIKQLNQLQQFVDHRWVSRLKLLLANDKNQIYIIYNYELTQMISNDHIQIPDQIVQMEIIQKGFILATKKNLLTIWMKDEENDMGEQQNTYIMHRNFKIFNQDLLTNFNISKDESLMILGFQNNSIACLDICNYMPEGEKQNLIDLELEFIYNGFHGGPITSMDICQHRPIIVTACRQDTSIRVWNYQTMQCDLVQKFQLWNLESTDPFPLLCIAIHPNGYYLASGFVDKIRIFHIQHKDLRTYREIGLKNCCQLRFSNGGHLLACAAPKPKSNSYDVSIYQAYTLERIQNLKGHTNQISELLFSKNDQQFYSCGIDGAIYEWSTSTWIRKDYVQFNAKYSSITLTKQKMLVACGNMNENNIVQEYRLVKDDSKDLIQRQIKLGQTKIQSFAFLETLSGFCSIVGGTSTGHVKLYPDMISPIHQEQIMAHYGTVTQVRVSPDAKYVISAGDDGCIFVFAVSQVDQSGMIIEPKITDQFKQFRAYIIDDDLGDILLMPKQSIESCQNEVKTSKMELARLEERYSYVLVRVQNEIEKAKHDAKSYIGKEVQSWSQQFQKTWDEKKHLENEIKDILKQVDYSQSKSIEELESLYEMKIQQEKEKTAKLESDYHEKKTDFENQIEQIQQKYQDNKKLMQDNFFVQMNNVNKIYKNTNKAKFQIKVSYEERLSQQEYELENQMRLNNSVFQDKQLKLKQKNQEINKANEMLRTENNSCQTAIESCAYNHQLLMGEHYKLQEMLTNNNQKIEQLLNDVSDRDNQIKFKDKKLFDFKNKVIELEKNKHVMAYRTAEMRSSLEPKEAQIEQLKAEIFKLEGEFEEMLKASTAQNTKLTQQSQQIIELEKSLLLQTEQTKQKQNQCQKITMDIHDTVKDKERKEWGQAIQNFFKIYVEKMDIKQEEKNPESMEEQKRQMQHLEQSISSLYQSSQQKLKRREQDIRHKTMENAVLLSDLNELRIENRSLQSEIQSLQLMINNQRLEIQRQRDYDNQQVNQSTLKVQREIRGDNQSLDNLVQQQLMSFEKDNSIDSLTKRGKLRKGTNVESKALISSDKLRLQELMMDLDKQAEKINHLEKDQRKIVFSIKQHNGQHNCDIPVDIIDVQQSGMLIQVFK